MAVRRLEPADNLTRWTQILAANGVEGPPGGIAALASHFELTDTEIARVVQTAIELWHSDPSVPELGLYHLQHAASHLVSQTLSTLVAPVQSDFGWDDLILPGHVKRQLVSFANLYRFGQTVRHDWGFGRALLRTRGLCALFSGPPGTGKTLSSMVIANHLGLPLWRVEIAQVVSKWVGETEKNLRRLFDQAEKAHCILLFDEADSFFSKRTSVKSSVDRYSNMEVNYLLQRVENFNGIAILTTNAAKSIDDAFQRRIQTTIEFPFPDEEMRALLWEGLLPAQAPRANDIDFKWLGEHVEFAGGHIKNALIHAAIEAISQGKPLDMHCVVDSCSSLLQSMGRLPLRNPQSEGAERD